MQDSTNIYHRQVGLIIIQILIFNCVSYSLIYFIYVLTFEVEQNTASRDSVVNNCWGQMKVIRSATYMSISDFIGHKGYLCAVVKTVEKFPFEVALGISSSKVVLHSNEGVSNCKSAIKSSERV